MLYWAHDSRIESIIVLFECILKKQRELKLNHWKEVDDLHVGWTRLLVSPCSNLDCQYLLIL